MSVNKSIVEERKTIDLALIVDGDNVRVETAWAVSVMPTEKLINMVLAYGSLHWKESAIGLASPGRVA